MGLCFLADELMTMILNVRNSIYESVAASGAIVQKAHIHQAIDIFLI